MAEGDKTAPSEFVRVSPEEYASSLGGDSSEDHILEQIDAPVVLHGNGKLYTCTLYIWS